MIQHYQNDLVTKIKKNFKIQNKLFFFFRTFKSISKSSVNFTCDAIIFGDVICRKKPENDFKIFLKDFYWYSSDLVAKIPK